MKLARHFLYLALTALLLSSAVFAQDPAKWTLGADAGSKPLEAGDKTTVTLKAEIESGWHLYALEQPEGGPIATSIKVTEGKPFALDGKIDSPAPIKKSDPLFTGTDQKPLETKFFINTAAFKLVLKATAPTGIEALSLDVRFQLCNDRFCMPPKTVRVSTVGSEDVKKTLSTAAPQAEVSPETTVQNSPKPQTPDDLWPFIWLAASLGALSLLTPCVFPMIPITVSYFTSHSAGHRGRAIKLATVYSVGIVATFTIVGMLLAFFVGAAGINLFAANPWINLLITGVFLFFAFNLFGAYEITIPSGILTKLDAITRSREGEGSGVVGALLMGLTFTLTSFTCTSPFVGTILVSASQGNWRMPLLGMLVFSTVFALPFFVLALAPHLISQLPRAGGWMNSVKVAMGFLEVAAAMKFISNVDLVWKWGIFTRDVVLAIWIAIGVVLTAYLLGKFQLSHDSKPERLGAFRVFAAVVSLAVSFYLLTGLFGAKMGELESFLPPDLNNSSTRVFGRSETEMKWIENDLEAAENRAKAENKLVFVDFTGYTCTNCRWMEANVFPKKEVEAELSKFVLARLYTDGEGDVYTRQQQIEQDMLGTVALPYYAVVSPDGKIISSFPGLTRNVAEFIEFLKNSQKNN
ncbi:MAG: cytochrome c biogenesis protein CcdA [Acidobacteriota bacterium]